MGGAVYIGMVAGSAYAAWRLGGLVVERAEFGWYLLWVVPFILICLAVAFILGVLLPWIGIRDWLSDLRLQAVETDF